MKSLPQPPNGIINIKNTSQGGKSVIMTFIQKNKTLFTIGKDGTLKSGSGSKVKITLNNISYDMVYTNAEGEEQEITISEIK